MALQTLTGVEELNGQRYATSVTNACHALYHAPSNVAHALDNARKNA